ncbi:hypothetical protein, partial [Salmonella enterica]|uniref:hypothetical protein n=1 Tax=Salmonella enterica TaxID=28901 RepID=UPI00309E45C5
TLIPDSGTHDFGALTLVDPDTFLPLEEIPPSVQELLHQAETALTDAIGHVDAAAASATQAATSATGAANSATASAASADSAASAAAAADTSRS